MLVVLAAAGASFAGAGGSPSPDTGKVTLRLGWNEGPLNLNPFVGYSTLNQIWMLNYDTLVAAGSDGLPSKQTGPPRTGDSRPTRRRGPSTSVRA